MTTQENTMISDVTEASAAAGGLTAEQSLALYYNQRLAYDSRDNRHPIGRYDSAGRVVPFAPFARQEV